MNPSRFAAPLLVVSALVPARDLRGQTIQHGLRVPAGFEVVEYADSQLANDIYCLTIDPKGRVVVAGRGYIRILVDDNADGKAERAIEFADNPKDGAMGLCWEGDTLYVTGDGGLRKFVDRDGDGKADGPAQLIRAMKTGGEHAAHAIRRGPDGWLYVLCGNMAGIDKGYATQPASPIKDPVAGCVLRFSPDLKESEIVAHGFRNPYDMDFNTDGELFTFDSDNERCVSLPWYEPTRFYHVIPGGHYGWLSPQRANFWRMPPYLPDVVAPAATLGRGSPTACICYRHAQFPKEYRGGFLLADWTFGKIWHCPLQRKGASYTSQPKVFLEAAGDNGLAPTGMAVHPQTGDLFVSIGGRGTRGAVYRVRYPKGLTGDLDVEAAKWATSKLRILRDTGSMVPVPPRFLDTIRSLQLELGDIGAASLRGTVWEGYTARGAAQQRPKRDAVVAKLLDAYPGGTPDENREILRTLAMIGAEAPGDLPKRWTAESDPLDNIHELIVWARCSNKNRATERVAAALLDVDRKITKRNMNRDSHWPLRIAELYAGLAEKDPKLHAAMVVHPDFGRPDHALFAQARGFDQAKAAAIFLKRITAVPEFAVNESVLQTLHALPAAQVNPVVRPLWGQAGHDGPIVQLLARQPEQQDRAKFVHGLASPRPQVLAASLQALEKLPPADDAHEVLGLLQAWKLVPEQQKALRVALRQRLIRVTRLPADSDERAWNSWFAKQHPKLAARLANPDGVDVAAWTRRVANLDWTKGDGERGRAIFVKASCAACHSGNQATGPDLKGVTKRFSRQDVLTAIVQPSRDVSARYQLTQVETRDGKVYQGVVIYDAVDSLILQTGATTTVRLAGPDVVARRTVATSLMPAGLLDRLSDEDIADLYAYLQ
ncbi:MAG: c-type cytochrome [Gemmataceae bacterium]|nr:c-type cytochrome [Gemmataceae bacterium]